MNTTSRALSARPDLRIPGLRVEVNVEGKPYGNGCVTAVHEGINTLVSVRLDGIETPKTFNARWVWATV